MKAPAPNLRLAAAIEEAGVSHKGLARRINDLAARDQPSVLLGTTHVSIGRWIKGKGIRPVAAKYLAEALSEKLHRRVSPEDLGMHGPDQPVGREPQVGIHSLSRGLDDLQDLVLHDTEGTGQFLTLASDDQMAGAVLAWMLHRVETPASSQAGGVRVSMRDVAAVSTAAKMFMQLDFLYGGGHGRKALRHYFRHEVLPLLRGSYTEPVKQALFAAAAEISQLLGWTAYDIGDHAMAQHYLLGTLKLSQEIDDRVFGSRALVNLSHQANYRGRFDLALSLASAAQDGLHGQATPRALALFTVHEARARASLGDEAGATRALRRAEQHLSRACGVTDPQWLSYVNEAELLGETAHCFRDLRLGRQASEFAQAAVHSTGTEYPRTLVFCRMVLAAGQLQLGDRDTALSTATIALQDAGSIASARVTRYVTDFQRDLAAHLADPAVGEFNQMVTAALTCDET